MWEIFTQKAASHELKEEEAKLKEQPQTTKGTSLAEWIADYATIRGEDREQAQALTEKMKNDLKAEMGAAMAETTWDYVKARYMEEN